MVDAMCAASREWTKLAGVAAKVLRTFTVPVSKAKETLVRFLTLAVRSCRNILASSLCFLL